MAAFPTMGLLWFAVIVALIPAALWMLKRTPYGAAMSGAPGVRPAALARTVGQTSLGAHQRIVTVEVGQGDERRWLVLGVTQQSISTLHTLTPQTPEAVPSAATAPLTFQALLKNLQKGRDERA